MSAAEISRRYAKALLGLTKQKSVHQKALAELKTIAESFTANADIYEYFRNPQVTPDQKLTVIKGAFTENSVLEEVRNLLVLLVEKHRIYLLSGIVSSFQDLIDEDEGMTRGVARAAKPLSSDALRELETKIGAVIHKKIALTFKEDPKILGGVIAEVGGWTFDDSIESHLKKMNEDLNRSAN